MVDQPPFGVEKLTEDVADGAGLDQFLHGDVAGQAVFHQDRLLAGVAGGHGDGVDPADLVEHRAEDVEAHQGIAAFLGAGIERSREIAVLRGAEIGQPRGDLEGVDVGALGHAAHHGDDLQVRAVHRLHEARRQVQGIAPGHAEKRDRRVRQDARQVVAQGGADDGLYVAGICRAGDDIGLREAEALAQAGIEVDAAGEGRIDGDAHDAETPGIGQRLVDAQAGDAQPFSDRALGQALDVIEPGDAGEETLLLVDLQRLRRSCHGRPFLTPGRPESRPQVPGSRRRCGPA